MTNEALIKEFTSGNVSAFNTLVWRWQKPVFNFTLRYMGDEDSANDIVQQTFIRVYKGLGKLRDRKRFSTWLFQIALNLCRDEMKRKHRYYASVDELENPETGDINRPITLISEDSEPFMGTEKNDLSKVLQSALQKIPPEQRVVIIMKEYHGLKFREIADTLEESVNTVKSRMYYGLTAMRKLLDEWNIKWEDLNYEL